MAAESETELDNHTRVELTPGRYAVRARIGPAERGDRQSAFQPVRLLPLP
ncbi:hypothetical protein ACIQK5_38560 [Streptomyces virginiae]